MLRRGVRTRMFLSIRGIWRSVILCGRGLGMGRRVVASRGWSRLWRIGMYLFFFSCFPLFLFFLHPFPSSPLSSVRSFVSALTTLLCSPLSSCLAPPSPLLRNFLSGVTRP